MSKADFKTFLNYATHREVRGVFSYVTSENRRLTERLKEIIRYRCNLDYLEYFVLRLENKYSNHNLKEISDILEENEKMMQEYMHKYLISFYQLVFWLFGDQPELYILNYLSKNFEIESLESFYEYLREMNIKEGTEIDNACQNCYCTVCSGEILKEYGEDALINLFHKMDEKIQKAFLLNLLRKVDYETLSQWRKLAQEYYEIIVVIDSNSYYEYISDFEIELQNKFKNWMKEQQIYCFFQQKEERNRAKFWMQYASKFSINVIKKRKMLLLQNEDYSILEYCSGGAVYIYEKDYYKKNVNPKILGDYSDSNVRNFLNHQSQYIERMEHRGAWVQQVANTLKKIIQI